MSTYQDYRAYGHIKGGKVYDELIRKGDSPEIVAIHPEASYRLSWDYPLFVFLKTRNIHYSSFGNFVNEAWFNERADELATGVKADCDYLVYLDDVLIGTDQFIYADCWFDQPIIYDGKISENLYLTAALREGTSIQYYFYPLRTGSGSAFLQHNIGAYFSSKGEFDDFGIGVLANMISLTYSNQYMSEASLPKFFPKKILRSMSDYQFKIGAQK